MLRRTASISAGVAADGEDVDVAAGLAAAPQAADRNELDVRRALAQVADELGGDGGRVGQQVAAGVLLPLLDRLQDQRFLLRAHSFELAQASVARGGGELLDRADVQRGVEQRHGLRPDALQAQQVEDGRRKLLQQLLVIRRRSPVSASSRIFAARSLPMPGQLAQLLRRRARRRRPATRRACRPPMRYARILNAFSPLISSRSAISPKHLRDGAVIHA